MRHPEGLKMSLIDESLLDSSGILVGAAGTASAYGLTEASVQLYLLVAAAGREGLAKSKLPTHLKADLAGALLPLELQNLIDWERDNRGNQAYLVLTWKGQEALDAARPYKRTMKTVAQQRRAAVTRVNMFE